MKQCHQTGIGKNFLSSYQLLVADFI